MTNRGDLRRDYEAEIAEVPERLRFAFDLARAGLQSMTLVNGGALIALFTLLGTGQVDLAMGALWIAFACFAVGIACALAAFLFGYLSQDCYYVVASRKAWTLSARLSGKDDHWDEQAPRRSGDRWLAAAIASAALSLAGFVFGAGFALWSLN